MPLETRKGLEEGQVRFGNLNAQRPDPAGWKSIPGGEQIWELTSIMIVGKRKVPSLFGLLQRSLEQTISQAVPGW